MVELRLWTAWCGAVARRNPLGGNRSLNMNRVNPSSVVAWLILLLVFVGLPALLRRYQIRAWKRNRNGACGRCGAPLAMEAVAYTDGLRVCPSCERTVRVRTIVGVGFIGLLTLTVVVGGLVAMVADARAGDPAPWWAYLVVVGFGAASAGLFGFAVRKTRRANQQAARRDAGLIRRYDTGEE